MGRKEEGKEKRMEEEKEKRKINDGLGKEWVAGREGKEEEEEDEGEGARMEKD